ncbi:O-antigen ligase family protein [Patescibacteria group bacterium]|nr:O-antigen ligase family protein [Patescibacteria group bacterium]
MKKVKNILTWLKANLLFALSTFLIAFIPLFPKVPLFDILPGYIVRVRAEDFLVIFTALVWLKQAFFKKDKIKNKSEWNTSYFWLVIAYAIVGLTSIILGTILLQTIPTQLLHIGKSSLHFFRYMEYFALFFFLYSSVKTKQHIKIILLTLVITVIGIIGYGYGQQYLHFPLYSTMNREYSKGVTLYLQDNARPQSTFAGHYDLGAYLVIVLPIIFALSLSLTKILPAKTNILQKRFLQSVLHLTHLFGAWMLVSSGSKTALAAYLMGILIVLFINLRKMSSFKQKLKWSGVALVSLIICLSLAITFFGQKTELALISIAQQNSTANKIIAKIPGIKIQQDLSDPTRPDDLYGEGHEFVTKTVIDEAGNKTQVVVAQKSIWSKNALKYGISMGIRLDTLWPQAINGLINNPLFGNGYATLSKLENGQYVEADSTDNNFLRTLGETGILGFITFYGLIIYILRIIYQNSKNSDPLIATLNIGLTGSVIGLLINAGYIDVFASSKVAYTFWAFVGIGAKSGLLNSKTITKNANLFVQNILRHLKKHRSFYFAFLILFFLLHKNPYKEHSLLRNFNTSVEAIENVTAAKCFIKTGTFSICSNNAFVLKENKNIYSFLLVPFLKIDSDPATFYFLNLTLILITFLVTYKFISKLTKNDFTKFTSLLTLIFIFYLLSATSEPLVIDKFLAVVLFTPMLSILLVYILEKQKQKLSRAIQFVTILFILSNLMQTSFVSQIKTNFRNNQKAYKNWTVTRSNSHFDDQSSKNTESYLITTISPYYFDLYKNDNYEIIPIDDFNEKSTDLDRLYITDFGIYQNSNYLNNFNRIKNDFDLTYKVIDCDEQCSILKIDNIKEKISSTPFSINDKVFDLNALNGKYSFSVMSHEYPVTEPTSPQYTPYSTAVFINNLLSLHLAQAPQAFAIFTGDILHKKEDSWAKYFDSYFGDLANYPILHSSKKTPSYYRFFSKNDYFIFLNLNEKSEINLTQKLFVYNSFLELEKLPNIKNIFIIDHNLDWQNAQTESNFITSLEKKLQAFPNLNKYIITSNHANSKVDELTAPVIDRSNYSYEENPATKTHYFANLSDSATNTSYIQFSVDENSNVSFELVG